MHEPTSVPSDDESVYSKFAPHEERQLVLLVSDDDNSSVCNNNVAISQRVPSNNYDISSDLDNSDFVTTHHNVNETCEYPVFYNSIMSYEVTNLDHRFSLEKDI